MPFQSIFRRIDRPYVELRTTTIPGIGDFYTIDHDSWEESPNMPKQKQTIVVDVSLEEQPKDGNIVFRVVCKKDYNTIQGNRKRFLSEIRDSISRVLDKTYGVIRTSKQTPLEHVIELMRRTDDVFREQAVAPSRNVREPDGGPPDTPLTGASGGSREDSF